jgi:hypothetical protein
MGHLNFETVLIEGTFYFKGNPESTFRGPIKKGFRPIIWIDSINKATSCSFILDGEIHEGESKDIEIVVLNQLALEHKIDEGAILNIGSTKHTIGTLIVRKHLGEWLGGKVP